MLCAVQRNSGLPRLRSALGTVINAATVFEIGGIIDLADPRRWIVEGLRACPPPELRTARKRPCIDTW